MQEHKDHDEAFDGLEDLFGAPDVSALLDLFEELPLELIDSHTAESAQTASTQSVVAEVQSVAHVPVNSSSYCWGAVAAGASEKCTPGFQIGTTHFKTKFCPSCTAALTIPIERVRACTAEQGALLSMSSKMQNGFWKDSPPSFGGVRMRLVNNTMLCDGPWLVIFEGPPSPLEWADLPSNWLDGNGQTITFCSRKGTLVPRATSFRQTSSKAKAKRPRSDDANTSGHLSVSCSNCGSSSNGDSDGRPSSACSRSEANDSFRSNSSAAGANTSAGHLERSSSSTSPSCVTMSDRPATLPVSSVQAAGPRGLQDDKRPFLDQYVDSHRRLASMLEQRLLQDDGSMPADQRTHLEQQLQHTTSLITAASDSTLAHWRSYSSLTDGNDYSSERREVPAEQRIERPVILGHAGRANDCRIPTVGGVLLLANGLGLRKPSLEVHASLSVLVAAGAVCTCCDSATSASALDELLAGQKVLLFCGHADARTNPVSGETTLAFERGGVAEAIDASALTHIISAHRETLRFVVLNGCRSLHLALRLAHAGVGGIVCWETAVPDEAATHFGVGIARSIAQGGDPARAFDAGVAAVLSVTELAPSGRRWVPKFALVSPEASGADGRTGRIPEGPCTGRVAAGLPWLIRPLPTGRMHGVPPAPRPPLLASSTSMRQAIGVVAAHRLRSSSMTAADGVAADGVTPPLGPRAGYGPATGPAMLVLCGPEGSGKSALAAWLCHDLRTQSAFPDGIRWVERRAEAAVPAANSLVLPALGRSRCLVVVDGAPTPPELSGGSFEQLIVVTTRSPQVASALCAAGPDRVVLMLAPPEEVALARGQGPAAHRPAAHDESGRGARSPAPTVLHHADTDSESTTWTSIVHLGILGSAVACLYSSFERLAPPVAAPLTEPSDLDLPFPVWWVFVSTITPYTCMILVSPANLPLLRSFAELSSFNNIPLAAGNLYTAYTMTTGQIEYPGMRDAGLPSVMPALFHLALMLLCLAHSAHMIPALRARADALPFRVALKHGMDQFKARHGPKLGTLLSLHGTFLPTSTYAYYLESSGYYRMPPPALYLHLWKAARLAQANFAALFLVYYVIVCIWTGGALASHLAWIPSCAFLNLLLEVASQPKRRRYVRACLFPKQSQSTLRAQTYTL